MKIFIRILLIGIVSMSFENNFAQLANKPGPIKPAYGEVVPICDCSALLKVSISNTIIQSAILDPKDGSCRVTAIVNHPPANDSVKVWIGLPVKNWNGRFEGTGGGGFLGGAAWIMGDAISKGFAAAASNTGHDGGSGSFALDSNGRLNWQLIQDYAYLGTHDMVVVGRELIKAFYGKPARYNYFVGGSAGGRQALCEAQRYPEDFDGILSLCPAVNWPRVLTGDLWPQVVMSEAHNYLTTQKFTAVNKAIVEALDSKDGTVDGVLDDPLHFNYDIQSLVGKKMGESDFTPSDADVIKKIWEGPRDLNGNFLWYGLLPGSDLTALAGTNGKPLAGVPMSISVEWVRFFLLSDPKWQGVPLTKKEFLLLWNQALEQYNATFATDNPDLSRFREHGGKLIILHGLADQLIPPQGSIHYYQQVLARMGGAKKTAQFARLFLIPGLNHAFFGPGPKPINEFESLIRWVEENKAPEHINAEERDKTNNLIRSRSFAPFLESSNSKTEQ
jgi:pimeloyl-ACP methyl ester carboxylesterase